MLEFCSSGCKRVINERPNTMMTSHKKRNWTEARTVCVCVCVCAAEIKEGVLPVKQTSTSPPTTSPLWQLTCHTVSPEVSLWFAVKSPHRAGFRGATESASTDGSVSARWTRPEPSVSQVSSASLALWLVWWLPPASMQTVNQPRVNFNSRAIGFTDNTKHS